MFDVQKAVAYLNEHARDHSLGRCAEFVRKAVEAGGAHLTRHASAKDYGSSLERAGLHAMSGLPTMFQAGDVAVIQPIPGHPHGHMTMYNGKIWVSDFKQLHGFYPGATYRKLKPPVKFYRNLLIISSPPSSSPTGGGSTRMA
jgi:hypothetical protein